MCQLLCLTCVIDLLFIDYKFTFLFFFFFFFSRTADLDGVSIVNQFVVFSLILSPLLLFSLIVLVETQNYILKCGTLDKKG